MKKKLIAIVTSLAMVATMVPAVAFANEGATEPVTPPESGDTQTPGESGGESGEPGNPGEETPPAEDPEAPAPKDAFLQAMKNYGIATTVPAPYTNAQDKIIRDLCAAYIVLVEDGAEADLTDDDVKARITQLKSLVRSAWVLRSDKVSEDSEPLKDAIVPAKNDTVDIAAITTLNDTLKGFYGEDLASPTNVLYTVLGESYLNDAGIKAGADRTLETAKELVDDANAVKGAVLAINNIKDVTADNYDNTANNAAITTARAAYNAVTASLKNKVGNLGKLTTAEAAKKSFEEQVVAALKVMNTVDSSVTITSKNIATIKATYEKAQAAYDSLPAGLKNDADVVTAKGKLDTVKGKIAAYEAHVKEVAEVQALIDALPANPTAADALQVARAQAAYNSMTTSNTDVLTGNLTNAVAKVKSILYDGTTADTAAVAEAVKPVQNAIAALPATITAAEKDAALEAKADYDALTTVFDRADNKAITKAFTTAEYQKLCDAESQAKALQTADRTAVGKFITAVTTIMGSTLEAITNANTVDAAYEANTIKARSAYDALTDAQKKMVADNKKVEGVDAKTAYDKLLIAEANVEAAKKVSAVGKLMLAVPDAKTLDVNDAAAVQKVKDAQAAYEALTPGVQTSNFTANDAPYKKAYDNYVAALEKVTAAETKNAAKTVIDAINALGKLPTAFESRAGVDAVKLPLEAVEKAYAALTDTQKGAVTNYAVLTAYRANYEDLLKPYVNKVYDAAAKIDVTAELTAEDIAIARELQAFVEDKYIDTKDIVSFKQDVYDALMEVLNKAIKAETALENATISAIETYTYDGTAKEPKVTATDKNGAVVPEEAYTVEYSNNLNAGTAYVIISAKTEGGYTGVKTQEFTINKANLKDLKVSVSGLVNKTYTGKAVGQSLTVKAGDNNLARNKDYTQTYKNNKNVGKASVILTGTGNYTGSITKTFIVTPKKGAIKSLKAGKKQVTVKVTAQAGAKYRIVYQTVNKANNGKAKAVNTASTSKTIKSLKAGKTYKVKVRGYKVVDGKTYYGAYSAWKKAKVK